MHQLGNKISEREWRFIGRAPLTCLTPPKVENPTRVSTFINAEGEKGTISEPERSETKGASFDSTNSLSKPASETKEGSSIPWTTSKGWSSFFDLPGCYTNCPVSWPPPTPEDDTNPSLAKEGRKEGAHTPNTSESGRTAQSVAGGWNKTAWRRAVKLKFKSKGKEVSNEEREEGEGKRVMTG